MNNKNCQEKKVSSKCTTEKKCEEKKLGTNKREMKKEAKKQ